MPERRAPALRDDEKLGRAELQLCAPPATTARPATAGGFVVAFATSGATIPPLSRCPICIINCCKRRFSICRICRPAGFALFLFPSKHLTLSRDRPDRRRNLSQSLF